jgi:nucleotide-binding universal stress UspA family protein
MKTILVPVDFSAVSRRVCDAACDLANALGAELMLLHVVPPPPVMVSDLYMLSAAQTEDMQAAAERAGERRLRELDARCTKRGIPTRLVRRTGLPVPEIVRHAAKADYLVMGSHGHGAMYDLLVGSTTHGVLKKVRCPVLIVPPSARDRS